MSTTTTTKTTRTVAKERVRTAASPIISTCGGEHTNIGQSGTNGIVKYEVVLNQDHTWSIYLLHDSVSEITGELFDVKQYGFKSFRKIKPMHADAVEDQPGSIVATLAVDSKIEEVEEEPVGLEVIIHVASNGYAIQSFASNIDSVGCFILHNGRKTPQKMVRSTFHFAKPLAYNNVIYTVATAPIGCIHLVRPRMDFGTPLKIK